MSSSLTVIAFLDGLASASPDKRLLPSLTVDEEILKAELSFVGVVRVIEGVLMAAIDDRKGRRWRWTGGMLEARVWVVLALCWCSCLAKFARHMKCPAI